MKVKNFNLMKMDKEWKYKSTKIQRDRLKRVEKEYVN